jgi:hypothetical protein
VAFFQKTTKPEMHATFLAGVDENKQNVSGIIYCSPNNAKVCI